MITKEQFLTKFDELTDTTAEEMRKSARKLLLTGGVNLEQFDDDYRLPKIVACATCHEMSRQWQPLTSEDEKEVANVERFI